MKSYRLKKHFSRRGMMVVVAVLLLSQFVTVMAYEYARQVLEHYLSIRSQADGFRARQIALSGFQAGITAVKTIPEEFLFTRGLALEPPEIEVGKHCHDDYEEDCTYMYTSYRLLPEDGKLNLNYIVRFDGEINENYLAMVRRLLTHFEIEEDRSDPIVDWIDPDDNIFEAGAEATYYNGLQPARKIKNYRMFSLSELPMVRNWTHEMVYGFRPRDENMDFERGSKTEAEFEMLQKPDFYLSNNLTAFMPFQDEAENEKINLNAARYHVLCSLSEPLATNRVLCDQVVKEIFEIRKRNSGYIQNLSDLQEIEALQREGSVAGVTLYQELVGGGGDLSGILKTETSFYRVIGVGSLVRRTDNGEQVLAVRRVSGIWDGRRLIYYAED